MFHPFHHCASSVLVGLTIISAVIQTSMSFVTTFKVTKTSHLLASRLHDSDSANDPQTWHLDTNRRHLLFLSSLLASSPTLSFLPGMAKAEEESIAERAARISRELEEAENKDRQQEEENLVKQKSLDKDTRTAFDFLLPVGGKDVSVSELVNYSSSIPSKAILVVNIKQDDPQARKNIPALMTLAAKYGKQGLSIIAIPSDQGYYEPDTSALIRLKLNSEYGYGINPATILTDKVVLLGTGAQPFMRWVQGNCRTPSGLGKIQANFEKFLIDGTTGQPLRRYPRKYMPYDISGDIEAVLNGKPLPPPVANYKEEWRNAAKESETDTYRFQKGLNVFDQ